MDRAKDHRRHLVDILIIIGNLAIGDKLADATAWDSSRITLRPIVRMFSSLISIGRADRQVN
jgi:hypothetical protein